MKQPEMHSIQISLADLRSGETGVIRRLTGDDISRKRLMSLGLISGMTISLETRGPLGDPKIYSVLGYRLSIPNSQARDILITKHHAAQERD